MFNHFSDETSGYHLFFEPTGTFAEELGELIMSLAKEYGGPVFSPHVTVLARIPDDEESVLIEKTERLAASFEPIMLSLGELRTEQSYFRSLYSLIEEQEKMRAYHAKAAEAFLMEPRPEYHAHLSLLYGNYPEERKAESIPHITLPKNPSFIADSIHLYETHGKVSNWRKVESFPLGT